MDYTKTADYAAKDALATGDLQKVIRGTELGADFDAIATAIATKYDAADLNVTLQGYSADTIIFASGTAMLFKQTFAPTGWTKVTTDNDAVLRVVSGTASTGGADAFSTLFGTSKSTASYALQVADMPAHAHPGSTATDSGHVHGEGVDGGGALLQGAGGGYAWWYSGNTAIGYANISVSVASQGGGGGHAHTLSNMNLKYVDCIVATKN